MYDMLQQKYILLTYYVETDLLNTFIRVKHDSTEWNLKFVRVIILINTLRPRQNGNRFADEIFKCISMNANVWIFSKISLKYVPGRLIDNMAALVRIMGWRWSGNKPCLWIYCLTYLQGNILLSIIAIPNSNNTILMETFLNANSTWFIWNSHMLDMIYHFIWLQ